VESFEAVLVNLKYYSSVWRD